jgi:transketolase
MNSVNLAAKLRKTIVQMAHDNKTSHVGGALSAADMIAVLYSEILQYRPQEPSWEKRDRFFYSKGHACTVVYAVLKECGFISQQILDTFTQDGSYLTSHVNHRVSGVELSTGSLGHALPVACGVALASKLKKDDFRAFCMVSDGELNEGSNWEAILFAAHHELNNLILLVDFNKIQSFGFVESVMKLEPLAAKFESFNWRVKEINGHDHQAIIAACGAERDANRPTVVIAHTIKGKGVDFMEQQLAWHYKSPDENQLREAINQIDSE